MSQNDIRTLHILAALYINVIRDVQISYLSITMVGGDTRDLHNVHIVLNRAPVLT
jgi:hypothetical protein